MAALEKYARLTIAGRTRIVVETPRPAAAASIYAAIARLFRCTAECFESCSEMWCWRIFASR